MYGNVTINPWHNFKKLKEQENFKTDDVRSSIIGKSVFK